MQDYLKAGQVVLSINVDRAALEKQMTELREKSEEENYMIKGKLSEKNRYKHLGIEIR